MRACVAGSDGSSGKGLSAFQCITAMLKLKCKTFLPASNDQNDVLEDDRGKVHSTGHLLGSVLAGRIFRGFLFLSRRPDFSRILSLDFSPLRASETTIKIKFALFRGGGGQGAGRKIVENAIFHGKRHDNNILKVKILLSRNFVVMAQAPILLSHFMRNPEKSSVKVGPN